MENLAAGCGVANRKIETKSSQNVPRRVATPLPLTTIRNKIKLPIDKDGHISNNSECLKILGL
jgi:hypothetical protein